MARCTAHSHRQQQQQQQQQQQYGKVYGTQSQAVQCLPCIPCLNHLVNQEYFSTCCHIQPRYGILERTSFSLSLPLISIWSWKFGIIRYFEFRVKLNETKNGLSCSDSWQWEERVILLWALRRDQRQNKSTGDLFGPDTMRSLISTFNFASLINGGWLLFYGLDFHCQLRPSF